MSFHIYCKKCGLDLGGKWFFGKIPENFWEQLEEYYEEQMEKHIKVCPFPNSKDFGEHYPKKVKE